MNTLEERQLWMFAAVTGIGLPGSPRNVTDQLASAGRFSPVAGLRVYQTGYLLRLLQCLRAEYSVLAEILGDALFDRFARAYLTEHPSHSYTLMELGVGFPDWLETHRPDSDGEPEPWASLMVDLARLERAFHEVYRDEGPEREGPCSPLLLANAHADARPRPVPGARVLTLRAPLVPAFLANRAGEEAPLPALCESAALLFRQSFLIQCLALEPWQGEAFSLLIKGGSIGELEQILGKHASPPQLHAWLIGLARLGAFAAID